MCYKVLNGSQTFSKIFWIFPKYFLSIEIKNLYFDLFLSLFYLETAIEIRKVHKHFIKLPRTIFLAQHAITFLDLNFLYISKAFAFLDHIFPLLKLGTKLNLIKALTSINCIITQTKIKNK